MLRSILICSALCALSRAIVSEHEYERSPSYARNANETLYVAQNTDSFTNYTYAICSQVKSEEVKCRVRVTGRKPEETFCDVTLTPASSYSKVKLQSILYFTSSKVLLKWLETEREVVKSAKYTIVDTHDCDSKAELSFPIYLNESDPSYLNEIVLNNKGRSVHFFISSKQECSGMDKCRLTYDADFVHTYWPVAFDFDLSRPVIRSEFYDNFYGRGYDSAKGQYKAYYIPRSGQEREELLSLNYNSQVVNSNGNLMYTICYTSEDQKTIHYKSYAMYTVLAATGRIDYPEPVEALSVDNPNPIVHYVVARKANCKNDECWNLYVTVILKNSLNSRPQVDTHRVKVSCAGDKTNLIVHLHGLTNGLKVKYGCARIDTEDQEKSYFTIVNVKADDIEV